MFGLFKNKRRKSEGSTTANDDGRVPSSHAYTDDGQAVKSQARPGSGRKKTATSKDDLTLGTSHIKGKASKGKVKANPYATTKMWRPMAMTTSVSRDEDIFTHFDVVTGGNCQPGDTGQQGSHTAVSQEVIGPQGSHTAVSQGVRRPEGSHAAVSQGVRCPQGSHTAVSRTVSYPVTASEFAASFLADVIPPDYSPHPSPQAAPRGQRALSGLSRRRVSTRSVGSPSPTISAVTAAARPRLEARRSVPLEAMVVRGDVSRSGCDVKMTKRAVGRSSSVCVMTSQGHLMTSKDDVIIPSSDVGRTKRSAGRSRSVCGTPGVLQQCVQQVLGEEREVVAIPPRRAPPLCRSVSATPACGVTGMSPHYPTHSLTHHPPHNPTHHPPHNPTHNPAHQLLHHLTDSVTEKLEDGCGDFPMDYPVNAPMDTLTDTLLQDEDSFMGHRANLTEHGDSLTEHRDSLTEHRDSLTEHRDSLTEHRASLVDNLTDSFTDVHIDVLEDYPASSSSSPSSSPSCSPYTGRRSHSFSQCSSRDSEGRGDDVMDSSYDVVRADVGKHVRHVLGKRYSACELAAAVSDVEVMLTDLGVTWGTLDTSRESSPTLTTTAGSHGQLESVLTELQHQTRQLVQDFKRLVTALARSHDHLSQSLQAAMHTLACFLLHGHAAILRMRSVQHTRHVAGEVTAVTGTFLGTLRAAGGSGDGTTSDPDLTDLKKHAAKMASLISSLLNTLSSLGPLNTLSSLGPPGLPFQHR